MHKLLYTLSGSLRFPLLYAYQLLLVSRLSAPQGSAVSALNFQDFTHHLHTAFFLKIKSLTLSSCVGSSFRSEKVSSPTGTEVEVERGRAGSCGGAQFTNSRRRPHSSRQSGVSPAWSTSSTVISAESPVLPTLTTASVLVHAGHRTPPRSTSSQYYTASWGSPYDRPVSQSRPQDRQWHSRTVSASLSVSTSTSTDSPVRHLEFYTPYLRPVNSLNRAQTLPELDGHQDHLTASSLANRARRTTHRLTEDWIRRHTGSGEGEHSYWLSDEESEGQASSQRSPSTLSDLGSSIHLDLPELDLLTPTISRLRAWSSRPTHARNLSTQTLRPSDFPARNTVNMAEASRVNSTSPLQQDASPPRIKKRIPWKGKNILVLLPSVLGVGQDGQPRNPMTSLEVANMLREWQQLGYDIQGFDLGDAGDMSGISQGQSCELWPATADLDDERAQRTFKVNVPDRKQWDAYVQELKEAKLRALGVTVGDDERPSTISPALSHLSRRTSMQYPPLPFSPPIPPSSVGSSHIAQANPFSPQLMSGAGLSTSQSSNPGSLPSPALSHAHASGKFNPRASISYSGEHPFGSPFQYPPVNSSGMWSPQQGIHAMGHARGGSPSLHHLGSMMSPGSPFPEGYSPFDGLAQLQQRQQMLQAQLQMHASSRPSPRLPEVSETEEETQVDQLPDKSPSKTPDAQRSIRHNASESLQAEIDQAEYHLEKEFERQLDQDDYSPHVEEQSSVAVLSAPDSSSLSAPVTGVNPLEPRETILHHPQPHSRGHSLSQRPFQIEDDEDLRVPQSHANGQGKAELHDDRSDLDTNPSNLGTPVPGFLGQQRIGLSHDTSLKLQDKPAPIIGHRTAPSISKLNVAAKEFRFDPSSSFTASQFSFDSSTFQSSFQPSAAAFVPSGSQMSWNTPNTSFAQSHSKHGSTQINAAAPSFDPTKSVFSFSTSGPTFNPDAPSFTPSFADSLRSDGSESQSNGIFGNINYSDMAMSKSTRKSKAIPIVRPDSVPSKIVEDDVAEGKDGRITQGEGRIKRARGVHDDGDSVPLFAEPSSPMRPASKQESPEEKEALVDDSVDKEIMPLQDFEDRNGPPSSSLPLKAEQISGEQNWLPHSFTEQQHAAQFNAALPYTSRRYDSGLPGYGAEAPIQEPVSPISADEGHETDQKGHRKTTSILSATAKPFEYKPTPYSFTFGEEQQKEVPLADVPVTISSSPPTTTFKGLGASMFATEPLNKYHGEELSPDVPMLPHEAREFQASLSGVENVTDHTDLEAQTEEPTFEEIDAIMKHLNAAEISSSAQAVGLSATQYHQPSPTRPAQVLRLSIRSPLRQHSTNTPHNDASGFNSNKFAPTAQASNACSGGFDDPFIPSPALISSSNRHLPQSESRPASDWGDMISESEDVKLRAHAHPSDDRIDQLVSSLLAQKLDPMERSLALMHNLLETSIFNGSPIRREHNRRSMSGALSDADDEDEETLTHRASSPRRDRKFEKIRAVITEALSSHAPSHPAVSDSSTDHGLVLKAVQDLKSQLATTAQSSLQLENVRQVVAEVVMARTPSDGHAWDKEKADIESEHLQRIADLEARLRSSEQATEEETCKRRAAEDDKAEAMRTVKQLEADLSLMENERVKREAVEAELVEAQRALRACVEAEQTSRQALAINEAKYSAASNASEAIMKEAEHARSELLVRVSTLEIAQASSQQTSADLRARLSAREGDVHDLQQKLVQSKGDAELNATTTRRYLDDAEAAHLSNQKLNRTIESLRSQLEESTRVREGMRVKLMDLQEDMARAASKITEDNAKRAQRDAEVAARQEVLDARLQAEARTRERLEQEIDRLEQGEREGIRAKIECKRLEKIDEELRTECHDLRKVAARYQQEAADARNAGIAEVHNARLSMQVEIDAAKQETLLVKDALEMQLSRLRGEMDHVRLEADTLRARHEMLVEDANMSKDVALMDLAQKHTDELENIQTRHDRLLENALEDAQRSEQQLLERLSLSSAKTEHLQDRVTHLEERLEIAKAAAAAAAAHATRSASALTQDAAEAKISGDLSSTLHRQQDAPEKISPQALRESILILQEQLQSRETTIESLEAEMASLDPEAPTKLTKAEDEIQWLREVLALRKSDLQDIIKAISSHIDYDKNAIRDAAIRLDASLRMEEQERERALRGGSAISSSLPNLAASLREAATPRVAQAVGPLAAAWGNWRRGRDGDTTGRTGSPSRGRESVSPSPSTGAQSFLSGLLTPPTSTLRTPPVPSAFASTGQRFTPTQLAGTPRVTTPNRKQDMSKLQMRSSPHRSDHVARGQLGSRRESRVTIATPSTPPMLRKGSYDLDARPRDPDNLDGGVDCMESDAGFYDDESVSALGM